jgi:hypothetical protein
MITKIARPRGCDRLAASGQQVVDDDVPGVQPAAGMPLSSGGVVARAQMARRPGFGAYALLDLTALGRPEDWEEPKGRVARPHPADPTFTSLSGREAQPAVRPAAGRPCRAERRMDRGRRYVGPEILAAWRKSAGEPEAIENGVTIEAIGA